MYHPASYLYLHFLFLLLINYIDIRKSVETIDFTLQIFLFTLYYFGPKTDFLEDSFFFVVYFNIPYSPEMTEYHGLGLVHFFVGIYSENHQVHFRYPSSNILVITNLDSS